MKTFFPQYNIMKRGHIMSLYTSESDLYLYKNLYNHGLRPGFR
jgi:hypothetical protein